MSNRILRDDLLNTTFQNNGFVVLPLLDSSEVNQIRARFNALTPDDGFVPAQNRYHCTFKDTNKKYKRDCFDIFKELLVPKLSPFLHEFELLVGNFYVKNGGGTGEFEAHQNWDVVDETVYTSVTAWVPLQDSTRENGTIEVVEKSHRLFDNIACKGQYYFNPFIEKIKRKYCKPVNLKAGEVIIFDDDLIHYSTTNDADEPRISIQLAFVPKPAMPLIYFFDPSDPTGFDVYEANSDFYLNHSNLDKRPTTLPFVKRVPNNNREISEEEFLQRFAQGDEIRKTFYEQTKQGEFSRRFSIV